MLLLPIGELEYELRIVGDLPARQMVDLCHTPPLIRLSDRIHPSYRHLYLRRAWITALIRQNKPILCDDQIMRFELAFRAWATQGRKDMLKSLSLYQFRDATKLITPPSSPAPPASAPTSSPAPACAPR